MVVLIRMRFSVAKYKLTSGAFCLLMGIIKVITLPEKHLHQETLSRNIKGNSL